MSKLADCRKFSPNVFNKNKCASCFKAKEEHSEEALENNRASRKVAKCGYLFAAPDWDFSNPINRTKRWQRRWFVLYDDGELTYSVDEHPETVPQAIIDMNRVVEVSEAEQVTGHPFSLALTAADRVHFLKGTSREESKWWFDILSMFPRTNMKTGRHKRNATFPGSKATTIIASSQPPVQQQSTAPNSPCLGKGAGMQPFTTPPMSRPRFHSHTESLVRGTIGSSVTTTTPATATMSSSSTANHAMQNFHLLPPVKDTNGRNATATTLNNNNGSLAGGKSLAIDEDDTIPVKEAPALSSTPAVAQQTAHKSSLITRELLIVDKDYDDKLKKRVIRREIRGARSARCNSEILTSMILPPSGSNMSSSASPNNNNNNSHSNGSSNNNNNSNNNYNNKGYALVLPSSTLTAPIGSNKPDRPRSALLPPVHPSATPTPRSPAAQSSPHTPFYLYMADVPRTKHFESLDSLQHAFTSISSSTSRARHSSSKDTPDAPGAAVSKADALASGKERPLSMHELGRSYDVKASSSSSTLVSSRSSDRPKGENPPPKEAVRGDPDGCGLDPVTSFCSPLPDRRTAALTNSVSSSLLADDCIKKGWLLRLSGGEWKKFWFVLRSGTLTIYRDHASEDAGIADDVVDLTQMSSVDESDAARSYGFHVATSDGKKHSLAALTSGIRSQWIQALRNACNQEKTSKMSGSMASSTSSSSVSSVSTLKAEKENVDPQMERDQESLDSFESTSDDDDDDDGTVGDSVDDDEDAVRESDTSGQEVLPPSPPLNRNPMSRVKERDRSRSSSRSRSRHRSGSPASSVRTDSPASRVVTPVIQSEHHQIRSSSPSLSMSASLAQVRLDAAKTEITRLLNERREHERDAKQQVANLTTRLAEKEYQVNRLASQLEAAKQENNRQISEIRKLLEAREAELKALRDELANFKTENSELRDNLKRERSEVYKLRDVAAELRSLLESRNDTLTQLQSKTDEVEQLNRRLKATQENLSQTQERLQRGIDENEGLFARLRQIEENRTSGAVGGPLRRSRSSTGSVPLQLQLCNRNLLAGSGSKKSLHRLDSLSDLSNIDYDLDLDSLNREALVDEYVELRARFERSLVEIRALKRELRQTQSALDGYEVAQVALKQQWQAKEADYTSQLNLMAARVQDLTTKMAAADKQVRQLKLKLAKSESREKRRTQSLKGRESFQLSKEVEDKLVDLEHKMAALSSGATPEREGTPTRGKKGFEETTKSFRMRRKSLEGGVADPMKILLRVDQLEQQVAGRQAAGRKTPDRKVSPPSKSLQGKPPRSSPLKSSSGTKRIPEIEETPKSSKIVQDLEQCIVELELVFGNKATSEGVVSKIRAIQQELLDPERSNSACVSSDGIEKIQELLRTRLSELKVKRDHERSVGRLDSAALSQIAAEKLALELAIAEQLAGVSSTEQPEKRENLRDAHWTVQKLGWLKRKLNGEKSVPALEQSTCFGTYCAALAERLSAVAAVSSSIRAQTAPEGSDGITGRSSLPPRVAQHLAEEERDLSQVFGKYKVEKIKELAVLLAHETLRMGDNAFPDNQLVEEVKVRQAWLEAQEIANKELVDSDIRQALTRMAEVFAEDVGVEERLASALLLWPVQQLQYEQRCQVVEEVLRSEMEEAVMLLSNAYEKSLKELKAHGGALSAPEVDLEAAISEFAEMVAHKALIDGHIAILQGESASQPLAAISGADSNVPANVGVIQETEEIVGPMCSTDFFPNALHCGEVAAILHRNLVEPRKSEDAGSLKEDRSGSSSTVNEDFIRQKYQAEIEHLRALTEKGMSAMEGSHKRIIAQLEEKHHQEIARLQEEKERALAEETQATLAALDAMRKAHEAEVQREISRFKEEFVSQMAARQAPAQPESPNRQHEMEEIRREILSLSEKYSHKCLESAALEQKVSSLGQQVSVFQRQITDLDARNQQLRAFLDAGPGSIPNDSDPAQLLRAKDGQLIMLQEDVAELQFCLRESQTREEELASLARNLGQYLRTERPLSGEEVACLRHRLEDLLLLSGPTSGVGTASPKSPTVVPGTVRKSLLLDDRTRDSPPRDATSRFHYVRSKDLTRSPSCPRLSGFLSLAPRLSTRPVPLTPRDTTAAPGTTNH